jgi:hypothetical protein
MVFGNCISKQRNSQVTLQQPVPQVQGGIAVENQGQCLIWLGGQSSEPTTELKVELKMSLSRYRFGTLDL